MIRYTTSLYLALLNATCLALISIGAAYGLIQGVFLDDVSHLTFVSAALMAVVLIYTTRMGFMLDRARQLGAGQDWTAVALPTFLKSKVFLYLGLCGTVIGLSLFAKHMTVEGGNATPENIATTITVMQHSMQTAFNATLVGIVCKLWVETIVYIQSWRIVKLMGVAL